MYNHLLHKSSICEVVNLKIANHCTQHNDGFYQLEGSYHKVAKPRIARLGTEFVVQL